MVMLSVSFAIHREIYGIILQDTTKQWWLVGQDTRLSK